MSNTEQGMINEQVILFVVSRAFLCCVDAFEENRDEFISFLNRPAHFRLASRQPKAMRNLQSHEHFAQFLEDNFEFVDEISAGFSRLRLSVIKGG